MDQDNVVSLRRPDDRAEDPLTEVLRQGARALLAQAVETEVAVFLASHADLVDDAGRLVIVLAIEPRDFEKLLSFGAVEAESEDGGDDEPYEATPMSPCWFREAVPAFTGIPLH